MRLLALTCATILALLAPVTSSRQTPYRTLNDTFEPPVHGNLSQRSVMLS